MTFNIDWARTLRTLAIAALLIALLGALLGSIGLTSPVWNSAGEQGLREAAPPPSAPAAATLPARASPRPA